MPSQPLKFITPKEAADLIRVSLQTVYSLIDKGEIPAVRVGGAYRIPWATFAEMLSLPADLGPAVAVPADEVT